MTATAVGSTAFDRYVEAEHARDAAALEMFSVLTSTLAAMFRRGRYVRLLTHDDDTDVSLGQVLAADGDEVYDFELHATVDLPELAPELISAWGGRDYRDIAVLNSVLYDIRSAGTYLPELPDNLCPSPAFQFLREWNPCLPLMTAAESGSRNGAQS